MRRQQQQQRRTLRRAMGRQVESTLGRERADRLRSAERRARSRIAKAIAPAAVPPARPQAPARRPAPTRTQERSVTPGGAGARNPLKRYFHTNKGLRIHKWLHYFDIYHRHFAPFRDRPVTIVEFGVNQGGSLQMWKDYFGPEARIIGVDIDPRCAALAEPQVEIMIGDQEDREFLREIVARTGPIDVVIEDGGHTMGQQLATFEELWPAVTDGGVFLVEDLHTSYWERFGGGHLRAGTFIEFAKTLIDQQHAWHSHDPESLQVDDYTTSIRGMHVYDSIIVFDKGEVPPPTHRMRGHRAF